MPLAADSRPVAGVVVIFNVGDSVNGLISEESPFACQHWPGESAHTPQDDREPIGATSSPAPVQDREAVPIKIRR
ncbi:hypothetical protein A4G28_26490 [Mycobacterium ostraviense]|uniref:Uncharacterized protein n=1 Tax=Mycobacterium ostraviense TaxID=2738409 RepID=A0A164B0U7_9MYCO|nr:hypothetical protein A4G28_26490 [Mycobacterium ostraviense]